MEKYCDLHTHSIASDGTALPSEVPALAVAAGLSAVALTDHNTVKGLPDFIAAAIEVGIEAVPGIEFTVEYKGCEAHMVGLFIGEEHYATVAELLSDVRKRKEKSNIDLVKALREAGYDIDYERIKALAGDYINRSNIATALLEKGYVASVDEAMHGCLSEDAGYYKRPERLQALDIIGFIRSIGALPVLAHPFLNFSEDQLREFLPDAVFAGLAGMETDYATFTPEQRELARSIADEFGLLRSGGSDWHGARKPDISLGRGKGDLFVPYEYFEKLKAEK